MRKLRPREVLLIPIQSLSKKKKNYKYANIKYT